MTEATDTIDNRVLEARLSIDGRHDSVPDSINRATLRQLLDEAVSQSKHLNVSADKLDDVWLFVYGHIGQQYCGGMRDRDEPWSHGYYANTSWDTADEAIDFVYQRIAKWTRIHDRQLARRG